MKIGMVVGLSMSCISLLSQAVLGDISDQREIFLRKPTTYYVKRNPSLSHKKFTVKYSEALIYNKDHFSHYPAPGSYSNYFSSTNEEDQSKNTPQSFVDVAQNVPQGKTQDQMKDKGSYIKRQLQPRLKKLTEKERRARKGKNKNEDEDEDEDENEKRKENENEKNENEKDENDNGQ